MNEKWNDFSPKRWAHHGENKKSANELTKIKMLKQKPWRVPSKSAQIAIKYFKKVRT